MEVGIIVLILIASFFTIALYCLLVAGSISDDEVYTGIYWDETPEENNSEKKSKKKDRWLRVDAWILVLSIMLFAGGMVVGTMISADHAVVEATPETEVVIETTESTSAPVEPSVPETEETIHIEETTTPSEPEPTEPVPEVTEAPVPEETTPIVDPDELEMLACVIYQEAGGNGSCDNCRRYVADIVLNRVNDDRFPNTIYEVLTAKGQYGQLYWTGIKWPDRAKYDVEKDAVARAYRIAEEVLSGHHSELYGEGYIWQAGFKQGTDGFWCCGHFYGR